MGKSAWHKPHTGIHKAYIGVLNFYWTSPNIENLMSRIALKQTNGDVLTVQVERAEQ